MSGVSLPAMLLRQAAERPAGVALRHGKDRSWRQVAAVASRFGIGLRDCGIGQSERVAIVGDGAASAAIVLGAQGIGAAPVALPAATPDALLLEMLEGTSAVALIGRALPAGAGALRLVVADGSTPMAELLERGETTAGGAPEDAFAQLVQRLDPGGVAQLLPTPHRGGAAMLSHRNLVSAATMLGRALELTEDDVLLAATNRPVFDLVALALAVHTGCALASLATATPSVDQLRAAQPTVVLAAARAWEGMLAALHPRVTLEGPVRPKQARQLREELGLGRVRLGVATGEQLAPEAVQVFGRLDLPIRRLYGQTEGTALATISAPESPLATVGRPLPGVELRIAGDGEILVRSPGVFLGYFRDAERTDQHLDGDGWLHTGDLGAVDASGNLTLLGRRERLIATRAGHVVDPAGIESRLRVSAYVRDVLVVGAGRSHLGAVIEIDPDTVGAWARQMGIWHQSLAGLAGSAHVRKLITTAVDRVNADLPEAARITEFRLAERPLAEMGASADSLLDA